MDPHLRIRSSSFVPGPRRADEPVRPTSARRGTGGLNTLIVVVAGSAAVAVVAEVISSIG
ncbi:MAG: hypothetical protein AAGD33_15315 [Actinomycetota bacterium]